MKYLKYILPIFIFYVTGNSELQAQTTNTTDFVTTWRVRAGNLSITIPTFLGENYSYSVEWGDGTAMSTGQTGDATHTYTTPSNYEVRISGTFPRIYLNSGRDQDKIIAINQWGNQVWTSMGRAFNGASNLAGDTASDAPDLSGVTNMASMFNGASSFNQDIGDWDVSSVTDMAFMFNNASAFDQDIGDWDVSSVDNATNMFGGVTLSTDNYDALLLGWSTIDGDESPLQTGLRFHAGNSQFCAGTAARIILMSNAGANWTITDGGQVTGCSSDVSLSGLTLSTGAFNETFVATTLTYTTSVGASTGGTTITAPTTNTFATIAIAGTDTDGNALSVTGNTVSDLTPGANTITITVTAQTGDTRDYTITVTRIVTPGDFFVTTWRVEAGENITIPTTGTGYNYTVDWGDATPDTDHSDTDTDATHTYTAAADYDVRIIGDFPRIFFNNAGDKDKIIDIKQWGTQVWTSMERSFNGATNMTVTATDAPDLSSVTDMRFMFDGATAFNQPVNHWDVSNIIRMRFTFRNATAFNQDIGGWNVSSVANMQGTFDGATAFNQDIGGWDVSAVGDMQEMFQDATAFNQDIGMWNVSSVTTMSDMFNGVTLSVANYDALLRGWSTLTLQSDVNFHGGNSIFCDAAAKGILTADPGSNWTIIDGGQCSSDASLSGLTLSTGALNETFDAATSAYTTSVTSVTGTTITAPTTNTFATITITGTDTDDNALSVTGNTVSGLTTGVNTITITVTAQTGVTRDYTITVTRVNFFVTTWRVAAVDLNITIPTTGTGYNYTVDWGDATPATTHIDTDASTDATHTYVADGDYEVRIIGDFPRIYFNNTGDRNKLLTVQQWGTISWTSMASAFHGCSNLAIPADDVPDLTGVTDMSEMFTLAHSFNGDISSWNVSNVTDMSSMFSGATSFNQDIGTWDVGNVTDMGNMFSSASSFNGDISSWNVSNVTEMFEMFSFASSFNRDLDTWNVSNVTEMRNMLFGASSFNGDISTWNVSNVTDMGNMFRIASSFNGDISSWNVSNVTDMSYMLFSASSFNGDISSWNVSNVTEMRNMFQLASSFNRDLGTWNVSNVTEMRNMLDNSGLSSTNYDNLLTGWAALTSLQSDVVLGARGINYCTATTNRGVLTDTGGNNWMITDAGLLCSVETDITAFNFTGQTGAAVIDGVAHTVAVGVAAGTTLTALVPTIAVSSGATIAPASGVAQDFTNGVAYTVTAQDGSTTQAWTVTITVNAAPDDITLANSSINENNAVNDVIGGLSATDSDASDSHTYSLVPGTGDTDNASFSISGNDLVAAVVFDHEIKSDYSVRIAADDGKDGTFEKEFALTVTDVTNVSQTITFDALADVTSGNASFELAATASSGLPVSYSSSDVSVASIAGSTVTIEGAGTADITASQAGDGDYAAATDVTQSLVVKQTQTITFNALAAVTFGRADFDPGATASSRLDVSYSSSDPLVASIAGSMVTIVGTGTTDITASQAGDADYIAATDVTQMLVVNQADQTITLTPVTDKVTIDAPFDVAVSSTSGLTVTLRVSGPATISGTILTLNGTEGTVTITADQAGNSNYNAASSVEESFDVVTKQAQTITFGPLADVTFGGADFELAATASSRLEVSYSSSDPSVASVAGNTVTIKRAGIATITASQAGDANYIAATDVARTLEVNQANQTITLTPVADKATTDAPFDVVISSSSGLPVTLTVSGPATISGTTLTLAGTEGTVTITADQAGNDNYHAAPSVVQSFEVTLITGLEEEAPDKILLYPIPANNTIYIDIGDQKILEMTVTDLNGKQMTVHAKDSQLDISSLKEGYYILRITTDQGVFSQKIIKQ